MAHQRIKASAYWIVALFLVAVWVVFPLRSSADSQDAAHQFQEADANINGHTLHYRVAGKGPVLLLLHGFTLTGRQWVSLAGHFTGTYTTVIPDLPGHGGSSQVPGAFSFAKTAEMMNGLLDKLGAERAYGMGHSAGAMTLLNMAAQRPGRLEAMILVGGPHYIGPDLRNKTREETWEHQEPAVQEWYLKMHPGGQKQVDYLFGQFLGLADNQERVPAEVLRTIQTRTLIIWGDRDPYFPLEIPLELYRALPQAALWVVPEQGHSPLWVDMEGSTQAAASFPQIAADFLARPAAPQAK